MSNETIFVLAKHYSASLWLREQHPNEVEYRLHADLTEFLIQEMARELFILPEVVKETNRLLDLRRAIHNAKAGNVSFAKLQPVRKQTRPRKQKSQSPT